MDGNVETGVSGLIMPSLWGVVKRTMGNNACTLFQASTSILLGSLLSDPKTSRIIVHCKYQLISPLEHQLQVTCFSLLLEDGLTFSRMPTEPRCRQGKGGSCHGSKTSQSKSHQGETIQLVTGSNERDEEWDSKPVGNVYSQLQVVLPTLLMLAMLD